MVESQTPEYKPQGAGGQAPAEPTPILPSILGRWVPVQLDVKIPLYHKDTLRKNGLLLLYPMRKYAVPAPLRFVAHPSLTIDTKYYYANAKLLKNEVAMARFTIVESSLTRIFRAVGEKSVVMNIELLPPKGQPTPRYRLLVVSFDEKEVLSGATKWSKILEGKEYLIWRACNESRTGAHWVKYYVFLVPLNKKVKLEWIWLGQKRLVAHKVVEV